jgi:hypothetical protein
MACDGGIAGLVARASYRVKCAPSPIMAFATAVENAVRIRTRKILPTKYAAFHRTFDEHSCRIHVGEQWLMKS